MAELSAGQSPSAGQIITFYSFKGGTGRTMALANVAWILAANGMRVLIADWDLESPGLHRFFQPFIDAGVGKLPGIVDFIRRYEWLAKDEGVRPTDLDTSDAESEQAAQDAITRLIDEHVSTVSDYAVPVSWRFPENGAIDFLGPGGQDNGVYETALSALDWDTLYNYLYGGEFFDALREYLRRTYDWVLIDSRTGLSDIADICTLHLPDIVVDCFTLSTQSIEGAARVANLIKRNTIRDIAIWPVPMRIDHSQPDRAVAGMDFARRQFAELPASMSPEDRATYWADVEVPYRAEYAYEETLAAFGDRPDAAGSLLSSYERIAARVTANTVTRLPPRQEWLRLRTRRKFSRMPAASPSEVVIDFSPTDQLWAEWIAAVLASAGLAVRLVSEQASEEASDALADGVGAQVVAVLSDAYVLRLEDSGPVVPPDLLISVADMRAPAGQLAGVTTISLVGLSESQAADRLIDRFDGSQPPEGESVTGAIRYPGDGGAQVDNLQTRNPNFTGRDAFLSQLREELRARGRALALQSPAVRGLGGVGKTQAALEYAHRFKDDYDIVWWVYCGEPQYVEASLVDLGRQLREVFGADVPEEGGVAAVARQVLQFLSEGTTLRWLLVYDNAEDIEAVDRLLPSGIGHVLITSRDDRWEARLARSRALRLGVFARSESVSHLRRRLPAIAAADAERLAAELGDMPLAVAAAGALLARENMPVAEYLRKLEAEPVRPPRGGHPLHEYPGTVEKAWQVSLDQLERTSAAAARLLGICSVMASEIGLDLIYSDAMVEIVRDLDPGISEPAMIAKLVRQVDLLALMKVDHSTRQVRVHRVVQAVVRERMSAAELRSAQQDVHRLLVAARPRGDVDDPRMWSAYRQIWPQLRPSQAELSSWEQAQALLVDRVRYLQQRDDLEAGRTQALAIESVWTAKLAAEPGSEGAAALQRNLYRLRFNLANILRDLGQFESSRVLDEGVLLGQLELLGDEHPHTLETRGSLAADLRALGAYREALTLSQATYESWSLNSGFGEDYAGTLSAAHSLALSCLLAGDFRGALRRDRQILSRRASLLGQTHPRTLESGAAVARDLLEAGRYREAVRTLADVDTRAQAVFGKDASITLNARLWLGLAQRCAGDPEQAALNIAAALGGLVRGFGPDSNDALAGRLGQGLNQLALGRAAVGQQNLGEALASYQERLGPAHPNTLICRLSIAIALCLEDNYAAARIPADIAAHGLAGRLGPDHPHTLAANMVQGTVLAGLGNLDDAATVEERVLAGQARVLGPHHPDAVRCRANLLLTLRQRGVNTAAVERQQVIAELAELLGAEHPDVSAAGTNRRLFCMINPQPF